VSDEQIKDKRKMQEHGFFGFFGGPMMQSELLPAPGLLRAESAASLKSVEAQPFSGGSEGAINTVAAGGATKNHPGGKTFEAGADG
jgi:hypothetical protein